MRRRALRCAAVVALVGAALALPAAAWADPITITATLAPIIGGTAAAAVATAAVFVATYGGYIYAAYSVYGGIKARRDAKRAAAAARRAYNDSLTDRTVTTLRADPPWRVVYGRCITGGDILAILTSDKTATRDDGSTYTRPDAYKHLVIAVAAHEVAAIHEVYIDGVPVGALTAGGWAAGGEFGAQARTLYRERSIAAGGTLDAGSPPTVKDSFRWPAPADDAPESASVTVAGNIITNPNAYTVRVTYTVADQQSWVRVEKALGTAGQTASAYLQAQCPDEWTAADRLRGIAYVVVTLDLEQQRFQGGPPGLTFDVAGRKIWDPRTSTSYWNSNPALVIRDWLTQPWGFGVDSADIDDASVIAAANACDVSVPLTVGADVSFGPTYTADGAVTTDAAPEAVLEDLANAMAGFATHTGGLWVVNAGVYTAPVLALTQDTQAGSIEVVQAGVGYDELINGVRARMIETGRSVESEIDPYSNAAYVTADGAELWADISLPWTGNRARARNLARILTEQTRESLVIRYPAMLHAWPLQVGDRVTVTNAEYGWTAKVFRVTDWQWSVESAVVLTLQEDAPEIYDLADAATADQAPNTGLPNPWLVPAIAGLAAASGAAHALVQADGTRLPRVRVKWSALSSAYVTQGGQVLVRWRRAGADETGAWRTVAAAGDATYTYLDGVQVGDRISIAVSAVNSLGGRGGEAVVAHTVADITAAPADPAGLAGSVAKGSIVWTWTASTAVDYAETEARLGGTGWSSAAPLWAGRGNAYPQRVTAAGSYTLRIKHRSASGQESANAASASVTVAITDLIRDDEALAAAAEALADAAEALALADGKIDTYWQTEPPAGAGEGDIWFDTNDGNRVYRYTSGVWTAAADTRIAAAISDAADAQATADGKVRTFVQTSAPTAEALGDLWFDTDDSYKLYRWSGTTWVSVADVRIAAAVLAAADAQADADAAQAAANTANGLLADIASDAKVTPAEKQLVYTMWRDVRQGHEDLLARAATYGVSSTEYAAAYTTLDTYLNGAGGLLVSMGTTSTIDRATFNTNWDALYAARNSLLRRLQADAANRAIAAQATADGKIDSFWQASAPSGGSVSDGDIWFDTDDGNRQYRRTAGVWVVAADTRIGDAISAAAGAQATADGKVVTFVQASAPTAEGLGDLWLDSDDGNRMYRWSGSAWVAVPVGTGGLAPGAATETSRVIDATATASWSRPGIGTNAVYRGVLQQVSWTNTTGATVLVECAADFRGNRTAGDGSVYLLVQTGASAFSSAALPDDGGLLVPSTPNAADGEKRLTRTFARELAAGATLHLAALTYITTAAGTTTSMSAAEIDLRIVAIKR